MKSASCTPNTAKEEIKSSSTSFSKILVMLGVAFLIPSIISTSFIWFCRRCWLILANFCQTSWDSLLDTVGEDPFILWVYGPVIISGTVYALFSAIYTICYMTNRPVAIRKYKIQPENNKPVSFRRLLEVIVMVLLNMTVVNLCICYVVYMVMEWRGYPSLRMLPTFRKLLADFFVFLILEEIGFYYSHRILHSKFFYKHIHKMHHRWTAPIAITAMYCHPIEHVFSNILPNVLGIVLMGSHVFSACMYSGVVSFAVVHVHCGYSFPFFKSTAFHDYHHQKFTKNFGALGLLDLLHGTYADVQVVPSYQRLFKMLLSKRTL